MGRNNGQCHIHGGGSPGGHRRRFTEPSGHRWDEQDGQELPEDVSQQGQSAQGQVIALGDEHRRKGIPAKTGTNQGRLTRTTPPSSPKATAPMREPAATKKG